MLVVGKSDSDNSATHSNTDAHEFGDISQRAQLVCMSRLTPHAGPARPVASYAYASRESIAMHPIDHCCREEEET